MTVRYVMSQKFRDDLDKAKKEGRLDELLGPHAIEIMNLMKDFLKEEQSKEVQSAKVYVFDFHLSAKNKMDITRKKTFLDQYFDELRDHLQKIHGTGIVECDVFLRKH